MSYRASQVNSNFFIADEDKRQAFKALKKVYGGNSWFKEHRCVEDVLGAFSFCNEIDADDNICKISYDGESITGIERMLTILAPFVKSGSFIEMCGEDGQQWRWEFNDGKFSEKKAKVSWG